MANEITGKTVIIVGGSRGIGLQWVKTLLAQGNNVVATARAPESSKGLLALSETYGDKLVATALDTTSPESISTWAAGLKAKIDHADWVFVNAGVATESFEMGMADVTPELLTSTFTVNSIGAFLVTQQLLKEELMGGSTPSTVVYTSSTLGSIGSGAPYTAVKMYAYRASKAALNMLVVTSSRELVDKNITSVCLCPGYVDTDMTQGAPGTITTEESITQQLKVLQDGRPLNGKFYNHMGEEVPW